MTEVFRYSVIRFRPFAETGEFANIGIVVVSLSSGEIVFDLAPKRFPRIRGFFDGQIHHDYGAAIASLRLELARASEYLPVAYPGDGRDLFSAITEQRESSIIFSEDRVIEGANINVVLERLFTRLVKRDFVTAEPAEVALTRDIRIALRNNGIRQFKSIRINDDVVPVVFPLAYQARTLRAIKPLAFSQKTPIHIFDYGAHWRRRMEYLLSKNKVREGDVLLAVDPPRETDHRMREAFATAMGELGRLPLPIAFGEKRGNVNQQIIEFAFESVPYELRYGS